MRVAILLLCVLALAAATKHQQTLSSTSSSSWLNLLQLRVKSLAASKDKGPIEELNAIIETIRARLNQEQTDANNAYTESDAQFSSDIYAAGQAVEQTVADLAEVTAALEHDNSELTSLQASIDANQQAIMTKDGQITEVEGRITAGTATRGSQNTEYLQKIADVDAVIAILDEIMQKANTGLSMLALKAKSAKVHSELKSLIQIVTSMGDKGDVDDLKRLVQMLKDELLAYKQRLTTEENNRASAWATLKTSLEGEATSFRNMRQELVDANADLAEQKTTVQTRVNTNTAEQGRLNELKTSQESELRNLQDARQTNSNEYHDSSNSRHAQLETLQQIQDLVNQRLITWAQHVAEQVSNVSVKVNCQMGEWSEWSVCPVCADAPVTKSRSRSVATAPQYGGDACPATSESADCGAPVCRASGWQKAMVIKGTSNTFNYDSAYWTNDQTYDQDGNLKTSAFFEKFSSIRLRAGDRTIDISLARDSLKALFSEGEIVVSNPRSDWVNLYAEGGQYMQPYCNRFGVNLHTLGGSTWYRVRVGAVFNQENDCGSPDSGLGAGLTVQHPYTNSRGAAGAHVACCSNIGSYEGLVDTEIWVNVV